MPAADVVECQFRIDETIEQNVFAKGFLKRLFIVFHIGTTIDRNQPETGLFDDIAEFAAAAKNIVESDAVQFSAKAG